MNYELIKRLKDSGFPNIDIYGYPVEPVGDHEKVFSQLSLSELIDACGDSFNAIWHHPEDKIWRAGYLVEGWEGASWGRPSECKIGEGSTPEEAVANLWLLLNKKEI